MFSNWFLKSFRILLIPFSFLYLFIIWVRNKLYDKGYIKSSSFNLPIICVGNLSVGGTGKTPMVVYLVENLKERFKLATLSRGYKRKTKGYALANEETTAIDIGDEPMLFYRKFPDVPVAVGEQRLEAIPQLLHDKPATQAIILDDAFQHRAIRAGLNIVLTDYSNLYTRDFYLPTGDLRDLKSSISRAEIVVVTKCPPSLSEIEKQMVERELDLDKHQQLYFSAISYGTPYHITLGNEMPLKEEAEVLLITGIANPKPLKILLEEQVDTYYMMHFSDHHIFTIDDWKEIRKKFAELEGPKKIILTTEKDATRLAKFGSQMNGMPFYVIPIEQKFLFNQETNFLGSVATFISNFKQPV